MQHVVVDVLVVGAGLAGLATTLGISDRRVTLLSPWLPPAITASSLAQGGIAAALSENDNVDLHIADTLNAGAGECDAEVVRLLCSEAASAILWLETQGVQFDRHDERWAMHQEAAHSRARVLHVNNDYTGAALVKTLTHAAHGRSNVEFLIGYTAIALTRASSGVTGVMALDSSGQFLWIEARDTVLATGGLGQLYSRTTNPQGACGDGLAMALAAGARCRGLEFVQFHPTTLDIAADPLPLMTEALRGAGAVLIDKDGTRFMTAIHPAAELAPRDVVAREVAQRTHAGEHVYLDATEVFRRDAATFPAVRAWCSTCQINPLLNPIPVVAAAHYHMGGITVDMEGRSSLDHLWACGEVASTGAHGANRLASNSLLEAVVFGRRVGAALGVVGTASLRVHLDSPQYLIEEATLAVNADAWSALRQTMWKHLGIVRHASGMQAALAEVNQINEQTPACQILLKGRLRVAQAMISAALARQESRGAHFRSDFPLTNIAMTSASNISRAGSTRVEIAQITCRQSRTASSGQQR